MAGWLDARFPAARSLGGSTAAAEAKDIFILKSKKKAFYKIPQTIYHLRLIRDEETCIGALISYNLTEIQGICKLEFSKVLGNRLYNIYNDKDMYSYILYIYIYPT